MKSMLTKIGGEESWRLKTDCAEAAMTRRGGHLGPVTFRCGDQRFEPFATPPWINEKLPSSIPTVARLLRGDFFCMPFGVNQTLYHGEAHPVHGETANAVWAFESGSPLHLHLSMRTSIREGRVDKIIQLAGGETTIYLQHVISGMSGRMTFGHHPNLRVPDGMSARMSVERFLFGQVFPGRFEDSARGGYSILRPGARFTSLSRIPQIDGAWADFSVCPALEGYDDLVLLASDRRRRVSWTALSIPNAGYVWFALKDPRVLPSTVLWNSNGGRYYPPWNGRHRRVIGLEEVVAYFHLGLAESAKPNALSRSGVPTYLELKSSRPTVVNYIMGIAQIPKRFDVLRKVRIAPNQKSIELVAQSGIAVRAKVDVSFLAKGALLDGDGGQ